MVGAVNGRKAYPPPPAIDGAVHMTKKIDDEYRYVLSVFGRTFRNHASALHPGQADQHQTVDDA